jgi:hypothetical protein
VPRPRVLTLALACAFASGGCAPLEDPNDRTADRFGVTEAPLCLTSCQGGQSCCTGSAYSSIPADERYYLTTFGGGADTQGMSCGGTADATWYYAADKQRFGCGALIRIVNPANGKCAVAQVADYGPGTCVEDAACKPIIDASPLVSQHLFNVSGSGWSDKNLVTATVVPAGTPLGPCTVPPPPDAGPAPDAGAPPPDAGPPPDGGAPGPDAGAKADSGVAPPDAGSTSADAGGAEGDGGARPDPGSHAGTGGCGCGAAGFGIVGIVGPLFARRRRS